MRAHGCSFGSKLQTWTDGPDTALAARPGRTTSVETDRWRHIPRVLSYPRWVGAPSGRSARCRSQSPSALQMLHYVTKLLGRSAQSNLFPVRLSPYLLQCMALRACLYLFPVTREHVVSVCDSMRLMGAAPCSADVGATTGQVLRSDKAIKSRRFVDRRARRATMNEYINRFNRTYRYWLIVQRFI